MRERLPDRRKALTFDFVHAYPGASERMFTASVGFHADGRVGELFVHAVDGASRNVNVDVHDAAIALSFALQNGANLADIGRAMLRSEDGRPHGFMGALIDAALALIDEAQA